MAVVDSAESVVRISRIEELAAAQRAAWRRVTAARGRPTRAQKDGSAERIAAAAQRLDDRSARPSSSRTPASQKCST